MTEKAHSADPLPTALDAAVKPPPGVHPSDQPVDQKINGPREIGGRQGPDPTRFGDWELRGRCIDF